MTLAQAHPSSAPSRPTVSLRGLTKRFPGVVANADVDIDLWPGEVHVLLGENGAGKSTLIAMLSGLQQPDEGRILVDGEPVIIESPRRALDLGIGTVFQHAMLVPSLSVVDNMTLGGPWWKRPDRAGLVARMQGIAEDIGVTLDPLALTGSLSLGEQQQAEIVRALARGSRVLILDEATAMLTPQGAEDLGAVMRRLVAKDLAVVFITHKLNEALDYGDRVSVLRLGRKVGELSPDRMASLDREQARGEIISLMFGASPTAAASPGESSPKATGPARATTVPRPERPTLEAIALYTTGESQVPLSNVNLKAWPGEILGIAGIDGNGQKELAETLAGQRPVKDGRILLGGTPVDGLSVGQRRERGLRYVTDDRLGEGTVGSFPVSTNLVLKQIGAPPFWKMGLERPKAIAENAQRLIREFDIRTPDATTPIGKLSGGNIQKALLARELSGDAHVVIFAKPTYGLDLHNIAASRRRIRDTAESGKAVILISTDMEELLELSDHIAVMAQGRLSAPIANSAQAREQIGALMSGLDQ
ncbi:putative B6 ABC transporter ATP-binding protein [Rhodospirillum sp. A1_3_36]|uniref:putative B6 ABC transporter ATP-binding protein n=1 Tax=Rhodospirillum sp. A1_3_36 TaxID=3391666 RepID=UPI0039A45E3B